MPHYKITLTISGPGLREVKESLKSVGARKIFAYLSPQVVNIEGHSHYLQSYRSQFGRYPKFGLVKLKKLYRQLTKDEKKDFASYYPEYKNTLKYEN